MDERIGNSEQRCNCACCWGNKNRARKKNFNWEKREKISKDVKSVYWGEKKIKGGRKYMYDGKILKNTSGYIERIGNKKEGVGKNTTGWRSMEKLRADSKGYNIGRRREKVKDWRGGGGRISRMVVHTSDRYSFLLIEIQFERSKLGNSKKIELSSELSGVHDIRASYVCVHIYVYICVI